MRLFTLTLHDQNMMARRYPVVGDIILLAQEPVKGPGQKLPPMHVMGHLSVNAFSERYDGLVLFAGRPEAAAVLDAHRGWRMLERVPTPLNGNWGRDYRLFCSSVDVVEAGGPL